MMEGWKEVRLGEVTSLIKRGIAPKYVDDDGYTIINQKCIRNGVLSFKDSRLTSFSKKVTEEKYIQVGDVLINSTGTGTLGRTAPVKKLHNETTVDTHVTIVRGNEQIDNLFLGYLLKYNEPLITLLGKGATNQIELSASDLKIMRLTLPKSKVAQQKIASILSSYDNLIENNLKRIKLLEEKAQQTYEEWFVRMKFPGYENVTIDEESGLPLGWEEKSIGDFVKTSSGGTPSKKKEQEYYNRGTIPWVKTGELKNFMLTGSKGYITELGLAKSSAKLFPANTVLLAMYGNTIGETSFVTVPVSTNQACCAFLVRDKEYLSYFIHQYLLYSKEVILNHRMGAAQENVSQTIIKNIKLNLPIESILELFGSDMKLLYSQIENLTKQNQLIKKARDILLPRLMSGMIDVEGL